MLKNLLTILLLAASAMGNQIEIEPIVVIARADPPLCILCEFIVKYADNLLIQNKTEQQIVTALEGVCNIVPQPLKDECITLVAQFAPNIVDLLFKYANDTKKVCQILKICAASTFSNQGKIAENNKADPPLCFLCEFIVKYADNLLIQNKTEQQIITALEGVCNIAHNQLKDECENFVARFGPNIVDLLIKYANDTKKVCQILKICPTLSV